MTEQEAIERIEAALRKVLPHHVWTDRIARTAWNEMKAIAREAMHEHIACEAVAQLDNDESLNDRIDAVAKKWAH